MKELEWNVWYDTVSLFLLLERFSIISDATFLLYWLYIIIDGIFIKRENIMNYEKLSKEALTCMYIKTLLQFVIVAGGLIIVNILFQGDFPDFVSPMIYGMIGIDFLYVLISPKIRYERYRYRLTEEELEVRKGLIVIKTEIVPIERLHKIEVTSGPLFRAFHLKEVLATTAGGDIQISYLSDEIADEIAKHLKKRINTIAVEERDVEKEAIQELVSDEQMVGEQDGTR